MELVLSKSTLYNLEDLETKIVNKRAGSSKGTLYSAMSTLYKSITGNTIYAKVYLESAIKPKRFNLYVSKISIPFGIFDVEFLGKECRWNHVKVVQ